MGSPLVINNCFLKGKYLYIYYLGEHGLRRYFWKCYSVKDSVQGIITALGTIWRALAGSQALCTCHLLKFSGTSGQRHCHPHFTAEGTEAQRDPLTWLIAAGWQNWFQIKVSNLPHPWSLNLDSWLQITKLLDNGSDRQLVVPVGFRGCFT